MNKEPSASDNMNKNLVLFVTVYEADLTDLAIQMQTKYRNKAIPAILLFGLDIHQCIMKY